MASNESKETGKDSFSVSPSPKSYKTKLGETGTEEVGDYDKQVASVKRVS